MIMVKSIGDVSMRESDDDIIWIWISTKMVLFSGCNTYEYDCEKH